MKRALESRTLDRLGMPFSRDQTAEAAENMYQVII
jgi:hypothetical protein